MASHGSHQNRQQSLETLAAHAVRCLPENHQGFADRLIVRSCASPLPGLCCGGPNPTVEDPDRVLSVIPRQSDELIQSAHLLPAPTRTVALNGRAADVPSNSAADLSRRCLLSLLVAVSVRQLVSPGSRSSDATRCTALNVAEQCDVHPASPGLLVLGGDPVLGEPRGPHGTPVEYARRVVLRRGARRGAEALRTPEESYSNLGGALTSELCSSSAQSEAAPP